MAVTASDETLTELRRALDTYKDGRALQALDALAAIRDDRALLHIHAASIKGKGKVGERARQILEEVCRQRGLSADELEDRIVPELGLDEHGTMRLDFGPRQFTVGFDEQLEPFVRDASGARLAAIPHAASGDDEEKAAHAREKWKRLKDEVKSIGVAQARRLERSMCAQRQWSAAAFGTYLVTHRLLRHFTRRLVFRVAPAGATFRVGEDGAYSDEAERSVTLEDAARIVIAHPVTLEEGARARWRQILEDYEIVQPFPQIERELVDLSPEELAASTTSRFAGARPTTRRFWGLKHRGWDLGWQPVKHLEKTVRATLELSPGLEWYAHGSTNDEEHEIGALTVHGKTFGALSAVARAELLRDVELLRARG